MSLLRERLTKVSAGLPYAGIAVGIGASVFMTAAMQSNRFGAASATINFPDILRFPAAISETLLDLISSMESAGMSGGGFGTAIRYMWTAYAMILCGFFIRRSSPWPLRRLLWAAALVCLPLLFVANMLSTDIFDYVNHGRLIVNYAANPYTTVMTEFSNDPFHGHTMWGNIPSVYGPLWLDIGALVAVLAHLMTREVGIYVLLFKLVSTAAHIATGGVIYRLMHRRGSCFAMMIAAAYLFNPLCLVEFAMSGHNDSLMIFLATAGILFDMNDRWIAAAIAFVCATLVKMYALPLLCFYGASRFWDWKASNQPPRRLIILGAVVIGTVALLYAPYGFSRPVLLAPMAGPAAHSMTKSLGHYFAFANTEWADALPEEIKNDLQSFIRKIALGITFAYCLVGAFIVRRRSALGLVMAGFGLAWCAIGSTWFQPWYATFPLALAAASGSFALLTASGVFTLLSFIIYFQSGGYPFSNDALISMINAYYQPLTFLIPIALLAVPWVLLNGLPWKAQIRLDSDNAPGGESAR